MDLKYFENKLGSIKLLFLIFNLKQFLRSESQTLSTPKLQKL